MKKTRLLILLGLLVVIAGILFLKDNKGNDKLQQRDFAVAADNIDKIFLVDELKNQVTLTNTENGWKVNGKYDARLDAMKNLMDAITRVKFRNNVPAKQQETIFKNLITKHVKVEVYENGKPSKFYFVGGASPDGKGTYMLRQDPESGDNYSEAVITHIPGFEGYLTPRFITQEHLWRNRVVFQYGKDELKEIQVNYPNAPENGFTIKHDGGNTFSFIDWQGNNVATYDTLKLKEYMLHYKSISYEAMATEKAQGIADSLANATPAYTIKCIDKDGKINEIIAHRRKPLKPEYGIDGELLEYDTDRMYAFINGQKDLFVIQYFVFDKLTVPYLWFLSEKS